jgi:hypothetical protein
VTAARLELTLLGLLSWCDRVLLTASIPAAPGAKVDELFVDAALGVVSFRRQLQGALSAAARAAGSQREDEAAPPPPSALPGLLR